MARRRSGPRLYLDKLRGQWVVRDGTIFERTGFAESERAQAEAALAAYLASGTKSAQQEGWIYFVTATAPNYPIKIGFTAGVGVSVRVNDLQLGCPYALYVLGSCRGTLSIERQLHLAFGELRMKGEWFRRSPDLLNYIVEVCSDAIAPVT